MIMDDEEFNRVFMQAKGKCPNCGTILTFSDAGQLAIKHDMHESVMCHNCGNVYTVELKPHNMVIKEKIKNIPITKTSSHSKRNFAKEFKDDLTKNDGKNSVQIFNDWTEQGHQDANYTLALIVVSKLNGIGDQNTYELLFKKAVMLEKPDDESLSGWYKSIAEEAIGKTHEEINERFTSTPDVTTSSSTTTKTQPEKTNAEQKPKGRFGMNFIKKHFSKNKGKDKTVSRDVSDETTSDVSLSQTESTIKDVLIGGSSSETGSGNADLTIDNILNGSYSGKNDESSAKFDESSTSNTVPKPEESKASSSSSFGSKSDSELTTGNPILDMELEKAYENTMREREALINELRDNGVSEDVIAQMGEPPSKAEFYEMFSNPKRLGIVFNIADFDGGYGEGAFRIFYKNLDPYMMGSFSIFDGDTRKTLYENDNQYCIAIQTFDQDVFDYVKRTMSEADDKGLAPLSERFIEGSDMEREMMTLVYSADVRNGHVMAKSNNYVKFQADESENWKI